MRQWIIGIIAAFAYLAVAGAAAAQNTGFITGRVTDAGTQDGINAVTVQFYTSSGQFFGITFSVADGTYSFGPIPAGTYFAATFKQNYLNELYDNYPCAALNCAVTDGTPISVTAGNTTPNIDFALAIVNSIKKMQFTPAVIPATYTQTVRFEATVFAPGTVTFEYSGVARPMFDDGTHGDVVAGDKVYTLLFTAQEILQKTSPSPHRPFIGYVRAGTSVFNAFVAIWTAEMGLAAVRSFGPGHQETDFVMNLVVPESELDDATNNVKYWSRRFFYYYSDLYDFVNVVTLGAPEGPRYHSNARNSVSGIGFDTYDVSAEYGSRGRLMGVNVFPSPYGFDPATLAFNHEIGHQWMNWASTGPFTAGVAHWPKGSIANAVMGYSIGGAGGAGGSYQWAFNANAQGNYVVASQASSPAFNTFELYMMGLVSPSSVGSFLVLQDQSVEVFPGQVLPPSAVSVVTVADAIVAWGARVPDSTVSQKAFRMATILVSAAPLDLYALSLYDWFARRAELTTAVTCSDGLASWTTCLPFAAATGGRASMVSRLGDRVSISAPPFTDSVLAAGASSIRAVHLSELRSRVDALRARYVLPAWSWTDPAIAPGVTPIKAQHLLELRQALVEVYARAGRAAPSFSDASLTSTIAVRAAHFIELRAAVVAIE